MPKSKPASPTTAGRAPATKRPGQDRVSDIALGVQRALAAYQNGDWLEAERCCRGVLAVKVNQFDALHLLGVIAAQSGRAAEAASLLARAVGARPDSAEAHNNRGNALRDLHRLVEALGSYERATALQPGFAEAHYNRGNVLFDLRRHAEALTSYERALSLRTDYADAWNNRGNALRELKRAADALASYDRAIAIDPDSADAWSNRGNALADLKRYPEVIACYERALQLDPQLEYLHGNSLRMRLRICDWTDWPARLTALTQRIERGDKASPPFVVLALPGSSALQRKAAEAWVQDKYPPSGTLPPIPRRARRDKIRLGYFSADFYDHAIPHLVAELFERHDKSRFELTAFSSAPETRDPMQQRLRAAFDRFIDVRHQSDFDVAMLARKHEIDIAVDLNGFTEGARTGPLALRAAPVQVNYLGYPGTMGAPYIDYLLADRIVVPESQFAHYAEKIVHLPDSFQANDTQRPIAERAFTRDELGLPAAGFVFCSFNNNYKILPETFDRWMRILRRVDGSVLWLFEDNAWAAGNLRTEAVRRDVAPERLIFAPRMPLPEHLARQRCADLFLDTLPYNAHTTASDALWVGLPVLTCPGDTFASSVAASLVGAVDLPELVVATPEDYEAMAVALATQPARMQSLRDKLVRHRVTARLFDSVRFARHIETAYATMHERYQAGLPPEHFTVPA